MPTYDNDVLDAVFEAVDIGLILLDGDRRTIVQPSLVRVYRIRSCSRLSLPCQNSKLSGRTR